MNATQGLGGVLASRHSRGSPRVEGEGGKGTGGVGKVLQQTDKECCLRFLLFRLVVLAPWCSATLQAVPAAAQHLAAPGVGHAGVGDGQAAGAGQGGAGGRQGAGRYEEYGKRWALIKSL